jgi:ankyrin repeat protein
MVNIHYDDLYIDRNKIIEIIQRNNKEELKEYIFKKEILLNELNNHEFDILACAIKNNASIEIIKYILKEAKYSTLNNGINTNIINDSIIYLINNYKYGILNLIFEHFIFNNDFIMNLLQKYRQKKTLSVAQLNNIILKEKSKIKISDKMYEQANSNCNYEAIKILFENDNDKRKTILCELDIYDILTKAIEMKDRQFVKEVLNSKKLNYKIYNFEKYFIKAKNESDIIKLLIDSSLNELPKPKCNDSSKNYSHYFNLLLNILIRLEDLNSIKYLIENNKESIDLNSKDINGKYPIFNACCTGNEEIFKYLLVNFNINCNKKSKKSSGITLLSLAISKNNEVFVEYLLNNGAKCNKKDTNGDYPLIKAIHQNAINIVVLLMEHSDRNGIDMNVTDINGNTPLTLSYKLNNKSIFKYLVRYLDINKRDSKGNNILYYALKNNDINTIKYLIQNKIDANKKNNYEKSPLDVAVSKGYKTLLTILENDPNNINLNAPDIHGNIPLTAVIKRKKFSKTEKEKLVKILILKGSNVNYTDNEENTPLIYAIQKEYLSIVKMLITNGADVNYYNCISKKYISKYAIDSKNSEIIKYLMKCNAEVTGDMVHDLIYYDNLEVLRILLDCYLNINIKDSEGNSPLANAIINCKIRIINYLIKCDGINYKNKNNEGKSIKDLCNEHLKDHPFNLEIRNKIISNINNY